MWDDNGTFRKALQYDSFGNVTDEDYFDESGAPIAATHAEAVDQHFFYTGQERDESTGLQQHDRRWYDPQLGRWLSEDPIGFDAGDPNLYRYVGNSPYNGTDPTGTRQAGNPLDNLPSARSSVPSGTFNSRTAGRPKIDQATFNALNPIGTNDYYSQVAAYATRPVTMPSTQTVTQPAEPGFFSKLGSFIYETASNYPGYLKTQTVTAGQTVIQTGHSAGDFIGDHASMLYYDPGTEATRIKQGAIDTAAGIKYSANYIYNNPREAATWAGATAVDYVDRLTSDPRVSGELLGDAAVAWATGGTSAAGKQAVGRGLATLQRLATVTDRAIPDVAPSSHAVNTGDIAVYRSLDRAGNTNYVGLTNDLERRAAEQLRGKGINIDGIPGLGSLSRPDARAVEQVLLEAYGFSKNGGTLLNQINSIAKSNPIYSQAIDRGRDILGTIGFPGF